MNNKFSFLICTAFLFTASNFITAQNARPLSHTPVYDDENNPSSENQNQLTYTAGKNYILVERTDLRRYDNGKYTGLTSREIRSFISPVKSENEYTYYEGNFYVWQETRRNMKQTSTGIHDAIESSFRIDETGDLEMIEDNGFPSFRSFPTFTEKNIQIGFTWTGSAERSVDPQNTNIFTKLPMYVEYKYLRDEKFNDEDVFVLSAKWATRYGGKYYDPDGDQDLKSATGMHNATMYVSKETGKALVIRDQVDETFIYYSGAQVSFKGSISLFTEYPPSYNDEEMFSNLQRISSSDSSYTQPQLVDKTPDINTLSTTDHSIVPLIPTTSSGYPQEIVDKNHISIEKTNAGLRLTIQDLQFKPNSPELLPGENERLDLICNSLKKAENQMFLVEGHTARIGDESNELQLSIDRAHTIANEMTKRGIPADRILCKGSGGKKPIADNNTPEGRALNRRVEITILN